MKRSNWLDELRTTLRISPSHRRRTRAKGPSIAARRARFEPLEERRLLASDYGDAPDPTFGVGPGNYYTREDDIGPSHTIVPGLRIGAAVDSDDGTLQNATANADDVGGALPDDEDGILNPAADLVLTIAADSPMAGFTFFDVPGRDSTLTGHINDLGQVVGWADGHGFLKDGETYTPFDFPGANATQLHGINNSGVLVGSRINGPLSHAFVINGSNLTPFDVPGSVETFGLGINNSGQIVGAFRNSGPPLSRGYLKDGNSYTIIEVPGSATTTAHDINEAGVIVGYFQDSNLIPRGFVKSGSTYTQLNVPGSVSTRALGINNAGQIAGFYFANPQDVHGFVKDGETYTTIVVPGATDTLVTGINDLGQVVGYYTDAMGHVGGFIYTAPAPSPAVSLRVTNTTGTAATLYGWIDYDANGMFDNPSERTSVAVPSGTNNDIVKLMLPKVPPGFTGTTYARFRLSTDLASAVPTGPAADGEVEDYRVTIMLSGSAIADDAKHKEIASSTNGGPALVDGDKFGAAVASIGDLDGDGVNDVAVGAPSRFGTSNTGAVHVLFMNSDGTVKASQRIDSTVGGGPTLSSGDYFGHSVAALGDLDGDGVNDLAVGASKDDTGGYINGAVYVLFMNSNGTVKGSRKIASGISGGPALEGNARFGAALSSVGDLDGDGVADLAVGASGNDTGGIYRGAVHVLFLNSNGAVKSSQKIAHGVGGGPVLANLDFFGGAVANVGDIDGDGITELAVGASGDDTGGTGRGAIHLLFLNANGTVKSIRKIASGVNGGPGLGDGDAFGRSAAPVGDLNGDGVLDLAVGAYRDNTGGSGRGAVHLFFLKSNGTVKGSQHIASGLGGGPIIVNDDRFGSGVSSLGDLDGDGRMDLVVGAETDDTGGDSRGALHTLFLTTGNTSPVFTTSDAVRVPENSTPVLHVIATDAEVPPQTVTYSIVGGADQAKFTITTGGILAFIAPPDFDVPTDANGDNLYVVSVQATDGMGGTATHTLNVSVQSTNESAPVFTSPFTANVVENTAAVMTVTATDDDVPPQTVTFSLVGGPDQARFGITPDGVLTFNSPPNYEVPTDANGDNLYVVIVQASDGERTTVQAILVTVTPVNDNTPLFASPAMASVVENTTHVMSVTATDADLPAQTVTLSIVGGADQAKFSLISSQLDFISPPDFESPGDANGDNVYEVQIRADDNAGRISTQTIAVTVTRPLTDFGDAPDSSAGVGVGNYNTRDLDNGPGHTIVAGLRMGANVDSDSGLLQNATANADDINVALPDDEDGLTNPASDLLLTIGAQPTVNVRVTNMTGVPATLYGWIDYNANGVFDNATERASIAVPNGTSNGTVTLVFPAVPPAFFGKTYARFRLSTSAVAANPTGIAADGEVEDHRATIIKPNDRTADSSKTRELVPGSNGVPVIDLDDNFGGAVAAIGDLDGDGITDMAAGAPSDDTGAFSTNEANRGAVYILFMNTNGTVRSSQKIANNTGGGPPLPNFSFFGRSIANLGDLDGDGVTDLAVGNSGLGAGTNHPGAVYVLFMNSNGTVKNRQLISRDTGGGPNLADEDEFGLSLAPLGDVDGDGVTDLAVGARDDRAKGAAYVLFMNSNGTVKASQKIANGVGGGPMVTEYDSFGGALASLGDIDGDGIGDLAAGASGDGSGAVYVLFLNMNGTVKSHRKIASGAGGGPTLNPYDGFGAALTALGDADGDGITDIAVGASADDTGGDINSNRGAAHLLLLNTDGTAKNSRKIASGTGGGPTLNNFQRFGSALASLGDLDGDGLTELAVGNNQSFLASSVHVLFLKPFNSNPVFNSPPTASVPENTSTAMTVTATDVDIPAQTITFSIVGGADQSKFGVTSGGALSFNPPPNFDAPSDANGDNVYQVIVQANDGNGGTAIQTIDVAVTPVNDNAPVFTSPDAVSVAENTTAAVTVTATDADLPPQLVTFSIVGGADQAKFSITTGGVLTFISPPNFEAPTDTNGDNLYVIVVQASDGSLTTLQVILVSVTDVAGETLPGDYNQSGTVDAADYIVWRRSRGQVGVALPADGDGNGQIDDGDYSIWRANFGRAISPSIGEGVFDTSSLPQPPLRDERRRNAVQAAAAATTIVWQGDARTSTARPWPRVHLSALSKPRLTIGSQDEALVAWLTASSAALRSPRIVELHDIEIEPADRERSGTIEALEVAFSAFE
jgi:hypothetical protein